MPLFPSEEWCAAVVAAANADPEAIEAGRGWSGDLALLVEAEGEVASFGVWCRSEEGRIDAWRVLADLDEIEELEPAYVVRAPYGTWKALLLGAADPVEAVLQRRVKVQGDLEPLIARMRFRGLADRILSTVQTRFPDEA